LLAARLPTCAIAMVSLEQDGYQICRGVLDLPQVRALRAVADHIAAEAGNACVRNLRSRSAEMEALADCEALRSLLPSALIPVRSILFDKREGANWPVAWHRDRTICVAEKPSDPIAGYGAWSVKDGMPHVQAPVELLREMVTLRIHLDTADTANGALNVIPQSHRWEVAVSDGSSEVEEASSVICECSAGDVLAMSPLIQHSSPRSQRNTRRRVLHFEYAPVAALHPALRWGER
jgi:hypothetical protein